MNGLVPFQRVMSLLMALAMLIFIVPLTLQRRQYVVAAIVVGVFFAYLAFNAWLYLRMRKSGKL